MKQFTAAVLSALLLFSLTACGQEPAAPPEPEVPQEEVLPTPPPPPTPEELEAMQVEALLADMTLEERVGQLFFAHCPPENAVEDVQTYHLGGYILFGQDMKDAQDSWLTSEQLTANLSAYQAASEIPLLIGVDEEGGTVVRISRNPNLRSSLFSSPQQLFQKGGKDAILTETAEKDALLKVLGINVNLAPVADVSTDPADFIYDRTYGQDAASTADYVARVTDLMAGDRMGSVLKHFPGYGNNVDTHTGIAVDNRPLEQFRTADFLPFEAGIQAGGDTTAIMVSHNIMTAVDGQLPASLSPAVHDLLREELNFDGVVMTDDLAMDAVASYAEDGSAAVMALKAGNDLLITTDHRNQIPQVIAAVEAGELDPLVLQSACRRVLQWKQALGLLPPIS